MFFLHEALDAIARLRGVVPDRLTFAQVQTEINAKRPIGVYLVRPDGGGHYVAITGYSMSTTRAGLVTVSDPAVEDSEDDSDIYWYEDFASQFLLSAAEWRGSFLMKG